MQNHLVIKWWDGSNVGLLAQRGSIFFEYDEAWLARGHNLSPLSLPFTHAVFNAAKAPEGLPGLIADCLPDKWGRRVAERDFAQHGYGELTAMKLLAWRGERGLGALKIEPALGDKGSATLGKLAQISTAALARGAKEIQRGVPSKVLPQLVRGGTAGGAYPKTVVVAYDDGTLSVDPPDGLGTPSILKFDLSPKGDQAPVELAYLEMARKAGINSVAARLIDEGGRTKRRHLLVGRFDVVRNDPRRRIHFHSASALLHREANALDYRDLFKIAIRLGVDASGIREVARRMVFNLLASNHDDHGKNHAFMYDEDSKSWALTPAFDLTYIEGMLDRGMLICGEVWPKRETLEALCLDAGIKKAEFAEIFDSVSAAIGSWKAIARKAGVSADLVKEIGARHVWIRSSVG